MAAQECDCDFISSGNTVIDGQTVQWYKETYMQAPVEKRGHDENIGYGNILIILKIIW